MAMPYVEKGRKRNAVTWWGDRQATVDYCKVNLPRICKDFGGDPDNVLIYGESGGGAKVSTLCGMPAAKGLFHRAVIQSGPSLRAAEPDRATKAASNLMDALGLKPGEIKKAQAVSSEKMLEAMNAAGENPLWCS